MIIIDGLILLMFILLMVTVYGFIKYIKYQRVQHKDKTNEKYFPPEHPNCRCFMDPEFNIIHDANDEKTVKKQLDEIPEDLEFVK